MNNILKKINGRKAFGLLGLGLTVVGWIVDGKNQDLAMEALKVDLKKEILDDLLKAKN